MVIISKLELNYEHAPKDVGPFLLVGGMYPKPLNPYTLAAGPSDYGDYNRVSGGYELETY